MAETSRQSRPGSRAESFGALKIGEFVRTMRHENGWTLSFVSEKTGIPVSALSKFETAKQSMTYVRLMQLAELYGVEPGQLLACGAAASEPRMLGRRSISNSGGIGVLEDDTFKDCYLATDLLNKAMTPIVCVTKVRSVDDWPEWSRHVGEEFVFVLDGQLRFHSEMYAPVQLESGESIYFDAEVGHAYIAGDSGSCRFLSVCQSAHRLDANVKTGPVVMLPMARVPRKV